MPRAKTTVKPAPKPKAAQAPKPAPAPRTATSSRPTRAQKPFQARNTVIEKGIRTMNGKKR